MGGLSAVDIIRANQYEWSVLDANLLSPMRETSISPSIGEAFLPLDDSKGKIDGSKNVSMNNV